MSTNNEQRSGFTSYFGAVAAAVGSAVGAVAGSMVGALVGSGVALQAASTVVKMAIVIARNQIVNRFITIPF